MCNNGITQFYLPPTHEPYLPLSPATRHHRPLASTHCAYPQRDDQAELTWVSELFQDNPTTEVRLHPSIPHAQLYMFTSFYFQFRCSYVVKIFMQAQYPPPWRSAQLPRSASVWTGPEQSVSSVQAATSWAVPVLPQDMPSAPCDPSRPDVCLSHTPLSYFTTVTDITIAVPLRTLGEVNFR